MFRLSGKSKSGGKKRTLLGLALKDRDWVVSNDATLSIDRQDKLINIPVGADEFTSRVLKLIAVLDVKYGSDRKLAGVKHMQAFVKMALRMTVYWHLTKKSDDYLKARNNNMPPEMVLIRFADRMFAYGPHKNYQEMVGKWFVSNIKTGHIDYVSIARSIIFTPGALERMKVGHYQQDVDYQDFEGDELDVAYVQERYDKFLTVLQNAYKRILSTRRDSNFVSNKRIKEVAQYLYDNLTEMNNEPIVLPSQVVANMDIEVPGLGVIDDHDMDKLENNLKQGLRSNQNNNTAKWAKMKIIRHPLTKRLSPKINSVAKKNSDVGVNPRSMNRYATDRKIFSSKTKRAGGTVLIDVSGSMNMSIREVEEIVKTLPASTVAIYSGESHEVLDRTLWEDTDNIELGKLQIIAENGKWVEEIPRYPAQNLCDGPALDWLSKQAKPQILVSDCKFSGIQKSHSGRNPEPGFNQRLVLDAMMKISDNGIIPIKDLETAVEWAKAYIKD